MRRIFSAAGMVLLMAGIPLQAATKAAPSTGVSTKPDEDSDVDANGNPAPDGLTNQEEAERGTNPRKADTDNDGKTDLVDAVGYDAFFTFDSAPEWRYAVIDLKAIFTLEGSVSAVNNRGDVILAAENYNTAQFQTFANGGTLPPVSGRFQGLNNSGQILYQKLDKPLEFVIATGGQEQVVTYPDLAGFQPGIIDQTSEWENYYGADSRWLSWEERSAHVDAFAFTDSAEVWAGYTASRLLVTGEQVRDEGVSQIEDVGYIATHGGECSQYFPDGMEYRDWKAYASLQGQAVLEDTALTVFNLLTKYSAGVGAAAGIVVPPSNESGPMANVTADAKLFQITAFYSVHKSGDYVAMEGYDGYESSPWFFIDETDPRYATLPKQIFSDGFTFNGDHGTFVAVCNAIGRLPGQPGLWKSWGTSDNHYTLSLTSPDAGGSLHDGGPGERILLANQIATNGIMRATDSTRASLWRNGRTIPNRDLTGTDSAWQIVSIRNISDNGNFLIAQANPTKDSTGQPITNPAVQDVLLVPIDISFEKVGDNVNIEDNKYPTAWDANGNPNAWMFMPGKGKRIFPDAKTPTDQAARDEVYVKVTGPPDGWKVQLKVFDVDDPTPSAKDPDNIVDANDQGGEKGDDNRGTAAVFTAGNAVQIDCTMEGGAAKISGDLPKLKVGMQPGDNYRVAVILLKPDGTPFDGQSMNGQVTNKAGSGYIPSGGEPASGFSGIVSPMLTVWRKLHVEQDTMEQVPVQGSEKNFVNSTITSAAKSGASFTIWSGVALPGNSNRFEDGRIYIDGWEYKVTSSATQSVQVNDDAQSHLTALDTAGQLVGQAFQLFDDDNYLVPSSFALPLPSSEKLITTKVQSKYYPAYIDIDTDVNNPNAVAPFKLNAMAPLSGGKDVPDSTMFWAYRVVAAYQPSESDDIDPDPPAEGGGEVATLGHSYGGDALIFMEVFRDLNKALVQFPVTVEAMKKTRDAIVAHELGHGPSTGWIWINYGLQGWFIDTADHLEGGLMANSLTEGEDAPFSAKSLKRFRSTDRWQK